MKGTGKILLSLTGVVFMGLLFVHLHIQSFLVSYQIYDYNKELARSEEIYRHAKFDVDQLKAPRLLEEMMSEFNLKLELPDKVHLLELPQLGEKQFSKDREVTVHTFSSFALQFLGRFVNIAQAKSELMP